MNAARPARRWDEAGDNRLAMAEALADELAADLVTKQDLAMTAADLRTEMQAVRTEIQSVRAEIHQQSGALIRWFAGLLLIQAGLVVGLIRLV